MAVLEGQNILVTISGRKNRLRVYYLSWLKSKIMKSEGVSPDVCVNCLCLAFDRLRRVGVTLLADKPKLSIFFTK